MGDPTGFIKHGRKTPTMRPVPVRILDWNEVYEPFATDDLTTQASRCMDCGVPFCTSGCPLGNRIPDWNDLVYRNDWQAASEQLHATNNFPEFTGRLCPAPCEGSCVLGIHEPAVTIKQIEIEIIERAFAEGWVTPIIPTISTGKSVAIVGSGPAGLAAAQQLTRAGHAVTVFERADRIGGLLRYGIPEFKMEKRFIDRRLEQMEAEGTTFKTGVNVGVDITTDELTSQFDAVVLAAGATQWRDLPIPGRESGGIYQAMEFLPPANAIQLGDLDEHPFPATGKDVVIIGGGDTGADCLGTALRHEARSIRQFEIMPQPPEARADGNPWPAWPLILRTPSAHLEAIEISGSDVRDYAINTLEFVADANGNVETLKTVRVEQQIIDGRPSFVPIDGTEEDVPAQMVLLAMGFTGPERSPLLDGLGVDLTDRGNVARDDQFATSKPGVFACGDVGRGQSLIVWAIAEGRSCAAAVDAALVGTPTGLPTPVRPTDMPLR